MLARSRDFELAVVNALGLGYLWCLPVGETGALPSIWARRSFLLYLNEFGPSGGADRCRLAILLCGLSDRIWAAPGRQIDPGAKPRRAGIVPPRASAAVAGFTQSSTRLTPWHRGKQKPRPDFRHNAGPNSAMGTRARHCHQADDIRCSVSCLNICSPGGVRVIHRMPRLDEFFCWFLNAGLRSIAFKC